MLTRADFDRVCKRIVDRDDSFTSMVAGLNGWSWNEHSSMPGFGFMSRSTTLFRRTREDDPTTEWSTFDTDDEQPDAATVNLEGGERLHSFQSVVFSATFQVPVFYFSVHASNGSPLQLEELVNSSLFRRFSLPKTHAASFALCLPESPFPLLSQGDHPTLGTPCWYLHPCETAAAVDELVKEAVQSEWTHDQTLVKWMEMWFLVLGSIIDFGE